MINTKVNTDEPSPFRDLPQSVKDSMRKEIRAAHKKQLATFDDIIGKLKNEGKDPYIEEYGIEEYNETLAGVQVERRQHIKYTKQYLKHHGLGPYWKELK